MHCLQEPACWCLHHIRYLCKFSSGAHSNCESHGPVTSFMNFNDMSRRVKTSWSATCAFLEMLKSGSKPLGREGIFAKVQLHLAKPLRHSQHGPQRAGPQNHQISSDIIRYHQISSDIIRYHQISSDIIRYHNANKSNKKHSPKMARNPLSGSVSFFDLRHCATHHWSAVSLPDFNPRKDLRMKVIEIKNIYDDMIIIWWILITTSYMPRSISTQLQNGTVVCWALHLCVCCQHHLAPLDFGSDVGI